MLHGALQLQNLTPGVTELANYVNDHAKQLKNQAHGEKLQHLVEEVQQFVLLMIPSAKVYIISFERNGEFVYISLRCFFSIKKMEKIKQLMLLMIPSAKVYILSLERKGEFVYISLRSFSV